MSSKEVMRLAYDKDGNVVNINEVERGKACECFCIDCGAVVIGKKGEVLSWHFAHDKDEKHCQWSGETELHLRAKEFIKKQKYVYLPINTVGQHQSKRFVVDDVILEKREDNRVPDIKLVVGDEIVFMEIAVTHFCDKDKIREFRQANKNLVEVDFSKYKNKVDFDDAFFEVAFLKAESKWLSVCAVGHISEQVFENNKNEHSKLIKECNQLNLELKRLNGEKINISKQVERVKGDYKFIIEDMNKLQIYKVELINEIELGKHANERYKELLEFSERLDMEEQNLESASKSFEFDKSNFEKYVFNFKEELGRYKHELEDAKKEFETIVKNKVDSEVSDYLKKLKKREDDVLIREAEVEKTLKNNDFEVKRRAALASENMFNQLLKEKEGKIKDAEKELESINSEIKKIKLQYGAYIKFKA